MPALKAPSVKIPTAAPQIDNPGGPGGYALPSTQANVAATNQSSNQTAAGQAAYLTDPGYQGALNSQLQGNQDITAGLNKQLSQALIGWGSPQLASLLSQYGYTLNPEDQAAAQANYNAGTATLAQLDQAHSQARAQVLNSLTGRGIASSGDLGYQTGQADQNYANNTYNAEQTLLGGINTAETNALSQRQQLQAQVDQALQGAWNNVIQNPGAYITQADVPQTSQAPSQAPSVNAPLPSNAPFAVASPANKTGLSANKKQGVFSVH